MNESEVKNLIEIILSEQVFSIELKKRINHLHTADIGNLLESLPVDKRLLVWKIINTLKKGEVILEVRGEVRNQLIKASKSSDLVTAVSQLQIDEIADLNKKLPKKVVNAALKYMDKQQRSRYEVVRDYPHDTAGGLMDIDEIAIRSDITIYVALRYLKILRKRQKSMPEHLDSIYVVDRNNKYIGAVSLKDLVSLPYSTQIETITNKKCIPIPVTLSDKKVAQIFEDRDLLSAPVIDEEHHLIGRITVDDVIDVIRREGEHMLMTPIGLNEELDVFSPVLNSVKNRSVWLGVNLINAFVAALTIHLFTNSIEKIVALAILMPITASMGGVVGNQTLTLITRGIALEQITDENLKELLLKEMSVGLINGVFWALIVGFIVYYWMSNFMLSMVCGLAMIFSLFLSTCAGTLIPLFLNKLNLDPALGGSVILVAITDVIGFFIFLSIATLLLLR